MNRIQKNNICIFQTSEALAKAAADKVIQISKQAIENKNRFVLSLSGGSTPELLFKLLASPSYRDQIEWEKTFVFWGDERMVPSNDNRNNANRAKALLLNHIPIPSNNIHPIPVDFEPKEAAKEYEKTLKEFFGNSEPCFDLIFLGLGEDGHTASLFPGSDVIYENKRWIRDVYVPRQNMFRITMTPHLINKAHTIVFLVEGEKKSKILNAVLSESQQIDKLPAQVIHPGNGNLYWFLDKKAAELMPTN